MSEKTVCDTCGRSFDEWHSYREHTKRKHGRKVKCRVAGCEMAFYTGDDRSRHEHSGVHTEAELIAIGAIIQIRVDPAK